MSSYNQTATSFRCSLLPVIFDVGGCHSGPFGVADALPTSYCCKPPVTPAKPCRRNPRQNAPSSATRDWLPGTGLKPSPSPMPNAQTKRRTCCSSWRDTGTTTTTTTTTYDDNDIEIAACRTADTPSVLQRLQFQYYCCVHVN